MLRRSFKLQLPIITSLASNLCSFKKSESCTTEESFSVSDILSKIKSRDNSSYVFNDATICGDKVKFDLVGENEGDQTWDNRSKTVEIPLAEIAKWFSKK